MHPDDTGLTDDIWPVAPHLDEGTVHAWLDDALTPDEAAAVSAHVADCALCAAATAEARGLIVASSGILAALDDERTGVTADATSRVAAAFAEPDAPALASTPAAVRPPAVPTVVTPIGRRRPVWRPAPIWQIAAALVLVAGGAALVFREAPPRSVSDYANPTATVAAGAAQANAGGPVQESADAARSSDAADVGGQVAADTTGDAATTSSLRLPRLGAPSTPPSAPTVAPAPAVTSATPLRSSVTAPPPPLDVSEPGATGAIARGVEGSASVQRRTAEAAERAAFRAPAQPQAAVTRLEGMVAAQAAPGSATGVDALVDDETTDVWLAEGDGLGLGADLAGCWVGASTRSAGGAQATLRLRLTTPAAGDGARADRKASAAQATWRPRPGDSLTVLLPGGTELQLGREGQTLRGTAARTGPDNPPRQPVVLRRTACPGGA